MKLLLRLFLLLNTLLLSGICWLAPDFSSKQAANTSLNNAVRHNSTIVASTQCQDVNASFHSKLRKKKRLVFVEESDSEESELEVPERTLPSASYFTNFYACTSDLSRYFFKVFFPSGDHLSYYASFRHILLCVIRV